MPSVQMPPGPWPHGLGLRACAFGVAGVLPGAAAVASAPTRPSAGGLLLYGALTVFVLLTVPALAAFGALTPVARGALAAVLPQVRFGAPAPGALVRVTAPGVFLGPRGLGGLLDDLRHRLARRGPPMGGLHAA